MAFLRPVTKTVISSTEFGQPVWDILHNLDTPAWVNVTMSTGFEQFGGTYKNLAYLEVGKQVFLQGMIRTLNDIPTVATTCATIPASIAPPTTIITGAFSPFTAAPYFGTIRVDIDNAGTIKVRSNHSTILVPASQYVSFQVQWVRV